MNTLQIIGSTLKTSLTQVVTDVISYAPVVLIAVVLVVIGSWKGFSSARSSYERIEGLLNDFPKDKEYMKLPAPKGCKCYGYEK